MPGDRLPTRLITRIESAKKEKQFYETHQLYRSLYHRLTGSHMYNELFQYMEEGSNFLLTHQQFESGTDLALLLLECIKKKDKPNGPEQSDVEALTRIHSLMTKDTPERARFIENAFAYFSSDKKWQHELLHFNELIAYNFWNASDYPRARYHFIHSKDGYACANLLIEFHLKSGYPSEIDLFIVQAVLQYLCLEKHTQAAICFHTYTRRHPRLDTGPPFKYSPLLNFIWFLLLATADKEKCQTAIYYILINAYERHLLRDPDFRDYLQKIGELFFHLPKARSEPSVLAGLLSSLGFSGLTGNSSGPSTSTNEALTTDDVD